LVFIILTILILFCFFYFKYSHKIYSFKRLILIFDNSVMLFFLTVIILMHLRILEIYNVYLIL
jgi:hypothetical protein